MPGLEEPTSGLGSNHRQVNHLHIRCCCMTEVLQSSIAGRLLRCSFPYVLATEFNGVCGWSNLTAQAPRPLLIGQLMSSETQNIGAYADATRTTSAACTPRACPPGVDLMALR